MTVLGQMYLLKINLSIAQYTCVLVCIQSSLLVSYFKGGNIYFQMSSNLLPQISNYFFYIGLFPSAYNYNFIFLFFKKNKLFSLFHQFLPFLKSTITVLEPIVQASSSTPHPPLFHAHCRLTFPLPSINLTLDLPNPRVPFHIPSCMTSVQPLTQLVLFFSKPLLPMT